MINAKKIDRRSLLKLATGSSLLLGLGALPRLAQSQAMNRQILLTLFLRGGADGVSFLHPEPGTSPRRRKYEEWRRAGGTRVTGGLAVGGGLAMHPSFAPLAPLLNSDELCFVPGLGGAQLNRSHFEQQDLIESGAGDVGAPRADGFLGRALELLPQKTEQLAAIALNELTPYSLKFSGASPLSVPDFTSFGAMTARDYRIDPQRRLRTRLDGVYGSAVCASGALCEAGQAAIGGIDDLEALRAETTPFPAERFPALASMIRADDTGKLKFLTLDLDGWDTHHGQGAALPDRISALATGLRAFYDAAKDEGVWNRITVVVMSEFGRTTRENGTTGTDHGYGGVGMVLGRALRAPVHGAAGWFPSSVSAPFYTSAESDNFIPRLIDHRQMLAQALHERLGFSVDALETTVFPGFAYDTARPRLFA